MISLKEIQDAAEKISGLVHKTPLIHSNSFSEMTGAEVFLKAENLQKTGSFKVRGAFYKLSSLEHKRVITASVGNHEQGVAFAASRLGIQAEVELHGTTFQEALTHALGQKDYTFVHSFDDEKIIAGQGTIGLEVMQELSDAHAVLVPVGGGGLLSGIAVAVKTVSPRTEVIGVQTTSAISASRGTS